jgi:tRNA(Glu) U13 pseudouridine synthase TruD
LQCCCVSRWHIIITQSYFWNFSVSHRIQTYGLAVVVGDLVYDNHDNTSATNSSEQDNNDDIDIDMINTDDDNDNDNDNDTASTAEVYTHDTLYIHCSFANE